MQQKYCQKCLLDPQTCTHDLLTVVSQPPPLPLPLQELENLRKQAEIIPQLMAECESVTEKLQVGPQQLWSLLRGDQRRSRKDLQGRTCGPDVRCGGGRGWAVGCWWGRGAALRRA